MKSLISVIIIFFGNWLPIKCQLQTKTDSLQQLYRVTTDERKKTDLLFQLGMEYEDSKPEIAANYYRKAFAISKKTNYTQGLLNYYRKYTNVLNLQGKSDSVKILNEKALELSKKSNDPLQIAISTENIGKFLFRSGQYEDAVDFLNKSYLIYAKLGREKEEVDVLNSLELLSYYLHNYKQGTDYALQGIKKAEKINYTGKLPHLYNNLGLNYIMLGDYENANFYLDKSFEISKKTNNLILLGTFYLNKAYIAYLSGNYEDIKPNLDHAKPIFEKFGESDYVALLDWGYSLYYLHKNNYGLSKSYADSALRISRKVKNKDTELKVLNTLSEIYFASQNPDLGFSTTKQAQKLSDSIISESVTRKNAYFEKKFELHKKQNQIQLQQAQIKNKNILNYIFVGSIIGLASIFFLTYRNYNHRKKLQLQHITELETEKKLLATQSLLKGQQEERNRLAKDLHDGLGGLLSGVKLQLGSMKGNLILSEENRNTFDRALLKLDESINEMRRVAYNMMPESLLKSGLRQAILDYCDSLANNQNFVINCELHGIDEKMDSTTEVVLYRLIQELVNNAVKHAEATKILVQVLKDQEHKIFVTIEDNGKGFDTEKNNIMLSSGMRSIQSRVNYLKGTMDVKSEIGKGTSVYIECKEENYG